MKQLLLVLALAMTVMLTACISTMPVVPVYQTDAAMVKNIETGCAYASAAYKALHAADQAGALSPDRLAQVKSAVAITDKVCLTLNFDTVQKDAFDLAVSKLRSLASSQ